MVGMTMTCLMVIFRFTTSHLGWNLPAMIVMVTPLLRVPPQNNNDVTKLGVVSLPTGSG
jgi:hypothetical protein